MLRTNTNKAKANIRKYIVDHFEPYNGENLETFEEVADYIKQTFYDEQIKYDRRKMTTWEFFKDWAEGLPSVLDTCYYCNRSAVEDLGDILEETEEERNKYTESQAEEMITRLIFRELYQ